MTEQQQSKCACGCGQLINRYDKRGRRRFWKNHHCPKGKYRQGETRMKRFGVNNPVFKGGRVMHPEGYVKILMRHHPHATCDGYVFEHRLVMENHLGRYLNPDELVHHKNGIKTDNRIENLQVIGVSEHVRMHRRERTKKV